MIITNRITQLPRTWYHGTTSLRLDSLEKGIDLNKGRINTDFGQGFYLTSNWDTSYRWAKSCAKFDNRLNPKHNGDIFPIIAEYEIETEDLEELVGILFKHTDYEWANFICENRTRTTGEINLTHDFAYGPLADGIGGKVLRVLFEDLKKERISHENFIKQVVSQKYTFPVDHQLSIHSESAVFYTHLKGVFNIEKSSWKTHIAR